MRPKVYTGAGSSAGQLGQFAGLCSDAIDGHEHISNDRLVEDLFCPSPRIESPDEQTRRRLDGSIGGTGGEVGVHEASKGESTAGAQFT